MHKCLRTLLTESAIIVFLRWKPPSKCPYKSWKEAQSKIINDSLSLTVQLSDYMYNQATKRNVEHIKSVCEMSSIRQTSWAPITILLGWTRPTANVRIRSMRFHRKINWWYVSVCTPGAGTYVSITSTK